MEVSCAIYVMSSFGEYIERLSYLDLACLLSCGCGRLYVWICRIGVQQLGHIQFFCIVDQNNRVPFQYKGRFWSRMIDIIRRSGQCTISTMGITVSHPKAKTAWVALIMEVYFTDFCIDDKTIPYSNTPLTHLFESRFLGVGANANGWGLGSHMSMIRITVGSYFRSLYLW